MDFGVQNTTNMKTKNLRFLCLGLAGLLVAGCVINPQSRNTHATSVMQFLFPRDSQHIETPGIPVLSLPLRVGVAFVPGANAFGGGISEAAKAELLKRVAAEFRGLPYVKSIEIIPTTYLRPNGGFENLDQIKVMFGVDVIALVAYDQIQFTSQGVLSLAYWTIVGAWVVQGERNDTQTLMEAVVFDVASRKMLFRAPGTSRIKASSTPVNLPEELQADSRKGFDAATTEMIANLKTELENFKVRVKESPDEFRIEHKPGYTGGGDLDAWSGLGLAGLALVAIRRRTSCRTSKDAFPG
jgi:rhombotail lipoprotein